MENRVKDKLIDYLQEKCPNFKAESARNNLRMFTCPYCKTTRPSANIIPISVNLKCNACKKSGNIYDMVRLLELDKKEWLDEKIHTYLISKYKLDVQDPALVRKYLDYYEKNKFDLVQLSPNQKIPIEAKWPEKHHLDRKEWETWIRERCNVGVKTGAISNILVVDVDQKPVPEDFQLVQGTNPTLFQETNKGYHFFYKYDEDFPKTRIERLKIDIETNGGQVVIPPSTIDGKHRELELNEIQEMPKEMKEFLLKEISAPKGNKGFAKMLEDSSKEVKGYRALSADIDDNFHISSIDDGGRHHNFMKLGGLFRKQLNIKQTKHVLTVLNKTLCNPPLTNFEFMHIVNSLDRYSDFDEKELAVKVLDYLRKVEEANARDVHSALEYKRERIDLALAYLVKEEYIIRRSRMYKPLKKMEWKDTWVDEGKEITDWKMPYFGDIAHFREGDLIVIGGKTGTGKTHLAMNMIKRMSKQGVKPKYISLESGSRFVGVAKSLGLHEKDFDWTINFDPENIELEEGAITILDWLLPNDYAQTDKLYKHFSEQLSRKKGILIVFVQLKPGVEASFFAPSMLEMFPALVAKFLYDEESGISSHFEFTKIREAKGANRFGHVKLKYNWDSKELETLEEVEARERRERERNKRIAEGKESSTF